MASHIAAPPAVRRSKSAKGDAVIPSSSSMEVLPPAEGLYVSATPAQQHSKRPGSQGSVMSTTSKQSMGSKTARPASRGSTPTEPRRPMSVRSLTLPRARPGSAPWMSEAPSSTTLPSETMSATVGSESQAMSVLKSASAGPQQRDEWEEWGSTKRCTTAPHYRQTTSAQSSRPPSRQDTSRSINSALFPLNNGDFFLTGLNIENRTIIHDSPGRVTATSRPSSCASQQTTAPSDAVQSPPSSCDVTGSSDTSHHEGLMPGQRERSPECDGGESVIGDEGEKLELGVDQGVGDAGEGQAACNDSAVDAQAPAEDQLGGCDDDVVRSIHETRADDDHKTRAADDQEDEDDPSAEDVSARTKGKEEVGATAAADGDKSERAPEGEGDGPCVGSEQREQNAGDADVLILSGDEDDEEEEEELQRNTDLLEQEDSNAHDAMRKELYEYLGGLKDRKDEEGDTLVEFPAERDYDELLQAAEADAMQTQAFINGTFFRPLPMMHSNVEEEPVEDEGNKEETEEDRLEREKRVAGMATIRRLDAMLARKMRAARAVRMQADQCASEARVMMATAIHEDYSVDGVRAGGPAGMDDDEDADEVGVPEQRPRSSRRALRDALRGGSRKASRGGSIIERNNLAAKFGGGLVLSKEQDQMVEALLEDPRYDSATVVVLEGEGFKMAESESERLVEIDRRLQSIVSEDVWNSYITPRDVSTVGSRKGDAFGANEGLEKMRRNDDFLTAQRQDREERNMLADIERRMKDLYHPDKACGLAPRDKIRELVMDLQREEALSGGFTARTAARGPANVYEGGASGAASAGTGGLAELLRQLEEQRGISLEPGHGSARGGGIVVDDVARKRHDDAAGEREAADDAAGESVRRGSGVEQESHAAGHAEKARPATTCSSSASTASTSSSSSVREQQQQHTKVPTPPKLVRGFSGKAYGGWSSATRSPTEEPPGSSKRLLARPASQPAGPSTKDRALPGERTAGTERSKNGQSQRTRDVNKKDLLGMTHSGSLQSEQLKSAQNDDAQSPDVSESRWAIRTTSIPASHGSSIEDGIVGKRACTPIVGNN